MSAARPGATLRLISPAGKPSRATSAGASTVVVTSPVSPDPPPSGARQIENRQATPSDAELIEAVRRGDQRVAALLYDRLIDSVERALFRIFGRREPEHDDLVQTVFEQVVRTLNRQSYAQACSLKTWASSIAAHVALNTVRSRRVERRVLDRSAELDTSTVRTRVDFEAAATARLELRRVRKKLAALPIEQSRTVVLHDVLGHGLAEIAALMQVPVCTAQTRLSRGRRRLLASLDETAPAYRR